MRVAEELRTNLCQFQFGRKTRSNGERQCGLDKAVL